MGETELQMKSSNCWVTVMLILVLGVQSLLASMMGGVMLQVMEETGNSIMAAVPKAFDLFPIMQKYPVLYEQSMNTVLIQELIRLE